MGLRKDHVGKESWDKVQLDFNLYPKQKLALNAEKCEILFGGAAGGGKSFLIRAASIIYALSCPGIQIYIIRRELKSLLQSMMSSNGGFPALLQPLIDRKMVKINNAEHLIQFKNGGRKQNSFASGSCIRMVHIGSDQAVESITGSELHCVFLDEAASLDPEHIQHVLTRVRLGGWVPPKDSPYANTFPKVMYCTNPSGPSRIYLKEKFVDPLEPYKVHPPQQEGELSRLFISSLAIDNDVLIEGDPGYLGRLRGLEKIKRDMYLYGRWDIDLEGLFSESYRREHNIIPKVEIPNNLIIKRGWDYGISNPWIVLYYVELNGEALTIDGVEYYFPRGTIIIIDELHGGKADEPDVGLGLTDFEIGKRIREFEDLYYSGKRIEPGPGDSATWTQDNSLRSPMDSILEGYYGKKVHNPYALFTIYKKPAGSRVEGYSRMRTMFKAIHNYKERPLEHAGLLVMNNCKNWIRQVPSAPRDPKNIEDVPRAYRDEYLDVTRYIVLSHSQSFETISASVF